MDFETNSQLVVNQRHFSNKVGDWVVGDSLVYVHILLNALFSMQNLALVILISDCINNVLKKVYRYCFPMAFIIIL